MISSPLKAENHWMFQNKIFVWRGIKWSSEKQQRKRQKFSLALVNSCFIQQIYLYHFIGRTSTCWNSFLSSCIAPYFKLWWIGAFHQRWKNRTFLEHIFFSKRQWNKIKYIKCEKEIECPLTVSTLQYLLTLWIGYGYCLCIKRHI